MDKAIKSNRESQMNKQQKLLETLKRCKTLRALKQIHVQILIHGLKDCNFTLPKLLSLSSDLGFSDYSLRAFRISHSPNVVSFNALIQCFAANQPVKALRVYDQMRAIGISPNATTFTLILRDLGSPETSSHGQIVHSQISKLGFSSDVFVGNTLLSFYGKRCRDSESARQVFNEMPERDIVSWNSMIASYLGHGEARHAMSLFDSMPEKNAVTWRSVVLGLSKIGDMALARLVFERIPVKDELSWNTMISGYMRTGDVKSALKVFHEMPGKTVVSWTAMVTGYAAAGDLESARNMFDDMPIKNLVSWNSMIAGYVHNRAFDRALELFRGMLLDGRFKPDETTLVTVLSACSHLGSIEHGKWVDSYVKRNRIPLTTCLGNAMIDMFAKSGDVGNAIAIFDAMPQRCVVTWTTMISGLAVNGKCVEALTLFDEMCRRGSEPDDVVFVAVLSACAHGGLVEQGKRVFERMSSEFGIKPRIEHYGCVVDLLGRAGKLREAIAFVENMLLKPNAVIWATILGSWKTHGERDLSERVARLIVDQEPSDPGYLTLVSNLSASIGRWRDVSRYRAAMIERGIEKIPGCSSIQIGNEVHEFLARDARHSERDSIYGVLRCLNNHCCE